MAAEYDFDDETGYKPLTVRIDSLTWQEIRELRLSNQNLGGKLRLAQDIAASKEGENVEALVREWVSKTKQETNHNTEETFTSNRVLSQSPYVCGKILFDQDDSSKIVAKLQ